jgi:hypothetical protein
MFFEEKKLGIESISELLQCKVNSVEPYALMLAPVYVYMKLNEKLVSVKAPLDFFTPEELDHLSRYEVFYIPKSVQLGSRFQTAAKIVANLLRFEKESHSSLEKNLEPAIYEVSNEILLATIPLWGRELCIDPFFTAVFADELCGTFLPEKMIESRELTVIRHDLGILLSGLSVFVLLHLGRFDLKQLIDIRFSIYEATVDCDEDWESPTLEWHLVVRDLKRIIENNDYFSVDAIQKVPSEWARKLLGRIQRIQKSSKLRSYPSLKFSGGKGEAA